MNSGTVDAHSPTSLAQTEGAERRRVALVFAEWCLRREAAHKTTYSLLLMPLFFAAVQCSFTLQVGRGPGLGRELFQTLMWISVVFVFAGGVRHASNAVCWQMSNELRDLVLLTGIDSFTMLWVETASRWWTVFVSIVLILPVAMYARTQGAAPGDEWIVGGCWLILVAVLTAGFAMIASVSSAEASYAEATAATLTVILVVIYHCFFLSIGAAIWIVTALINGHWWDLPPESIGGQLAQFSFGLAPINQLNRVISSPASFTPFAPAFWIHFVTGVYCLRLATIVMRNRFRATTAGQTMTAELVTHSTGAQTPALLRPRCGEDPFFWKDVYILGGGEVSRSLWNASSGVAVIGVVVSAMYGVSFVVGMVLICLAPLFVLLRFDALISSEFREQTWNSLILLPVGLREPIASKVRAACWERRSILIPVGLGAILASFHDVSAVIMALVIASMASILLLEISVLKHFTSIVTWANTIVGFLYTLVILIASSVIWQFTNRWIVFAFTIVMMTLMSIGLLSQIYLRLQVWSADE